MFKIAAGEKSLYRKLLHCLYLGTLQAMLLLLISCSKGGGSTQILSISNPSDENYLHLQNVGDQSVRLIAPDLLEVTRFTTWDYGNAKLTEWDFVSGGLLQPPVGKIQIGSAGKSYTPVKWSLKRRAHYAAFLDRDLRVINQLYIWLDSKVSENEELTIKNPDSSLWPSNVTYSVKNDPLRFSSAIHVNQVGYTSAYAKKAFVSVYLGSEGELDLTAYPQFNILNNTDNAIVYSGTMAVKADVGYKALPYQKVLVANFSGFNKEGVYKLQVSGLGVSYPFTINNNSFMANARAYALGAYHQRDGNSDRDLPFTRFRSRPAHMAPAAIPTATDTQFVTANTMLVNFVNENYPQLLAKYTAPKITGFDASLLFPSIQQGSIDTSGGHHDAGDYSKYTPAVAHAISTLVFAVDNFPGVKDLDNLGLPESGDGKSDVLQEAKWEADYLAKLQDSDGGFYFLIYPKNRKYEEGVLPENGDPQILFPKSTLSTAVAVAALADIASSPTFKAQFPTEAAAYLVKAKLGWDFLINAINKYGKDGSYQVITHYGAIFGHDDELAAAAAAMFAATGEKQYETKLMEWYPDPATTFVRFGWWHLFEASGTALRSYVFAVSSGRLPDYSSYDTIYLDKARAEIINGGDIVLNWTEKNAFDVAYSLSSKGFASGVAGYIFPDSIAFDMAVAYQLQPDVLNKARYLDAIAGNLNYVSGANPVNQVYVTGLGYKRFRELVSQQSVNDIRTLPITGIPRGAISNGVPYLNQYTLSNGSNLLTQLNFPADNLATPNGFPHPERFTDAFNIGDEMVFGTDLARAFSSSLFVASLSGTNKQPWTFANATIAGVPSTVVSASVPVELTVQAGGLDLSQAVIVWEAKNSQPFMGHSFSYLPLHAGPQWVEVEIQLPDGRRSFAKANFEAYDTVTNDSSLYQPPGVIPETSVYTSNSMITWFSFNNKDLTLAPAPATAITALGSVSVADKYFLWPHAGQGTLAFLGSDDKLVLTIPASKVIVANPKKISIEAMVYIEEYPKFQINSMNIVKLTYGFNAYMSFFQSKFTTRNIDAYNWTGYNAIPRDFDAVFKPKQWNHLRITLTDHYTIEINGKQIAASNPDLTLLGLWKTTGNVTLELGHMTGYIDDVVIKSEM